MLDRIQEFCGLLRHNGVRVSTAEVIDAARAVEAVGWGSELRLRVALAASTIKKESDRATFDELFDLYFRRGTGVIDATSGSPLGDVLRDASLDGDELSQVLEALRDAALGMSALERAGLGMSAPEVAGLVRAAGVAAELEGMTSPLQVGYYSYRVIDALDIASAEEQLIAMLRRLRDQGTLDDRAYEGLAGLVSSNIADLTTAIRRYVEEEFRRGNLDFMQQVSVRALSDKPLGQLTIAEIEDLRGEVARLARILRARVSLVTRTKRRGRLDLPRTLRASLATGGIPFVLHHRHRRRKKPRLVVLCDISDSVRNVSRFMLQFVYTLQELFDRVYSFAFVSDIGELTELFQRHDLGRAVELAYSGAVVNVFANSNYGRAFEQFAQRHISKITTRTTVLVIGDGRNNYNPARAHVIADIRRRAKQVVWLNPESPAAWGFGDSAMREYEVHCDKVVVAHNLDSLRQVVDDLIL